MTYSLRQHQFFFNTIATKELANSILEKIKNTPIENNYIIVNYSDEAMCIFKVIEKTNNKIILEFISTAS